MFEVIFTNMHETRLNRFFPVYDLTKCLIHLIPQTQFGSNCPVNRIIHALRGKGHGRVWLNFQTTDPKFLKSPQK